MGGKLWTKSSIWAVQRDECVYFLGKICVISHVNEIWQIRLMITKDDCVFRTKFTISYSKKWFDS